MADPKDKKTVMRSLGEFFGHIVRGVRTDPARTTPRTVVRTEVEEEDRGDVVLRRTTIEEIEIKRPEDQPPPPDSPSTPTPTPDPDP
jgi:hypothetical protein